MPEVLASYSTIRKAKCFTGEEERDVGSFLPIALLSL